MAKISLHQIKVYELFLANSSRWTTSRDASTQANVAVRTANQHMLKLFKLGILDRAEVFGGYKYRLSKSQRNSSYAQKLQDAGRVFEQAEKDESSNANQ